MRIEQLEPAPVLPPVESKKRPAEDTEAERSPRTPSAPAQPPEDDLPQLPETD